MPYGTFYLEKMYEHKGINWEELDAITKVQTDSRKLQNGNFPSPEASQLEKLPCTLNSTEPLPHANCDVRGPPPKSATRRPSFFGNRGAEIRTSRDDQKTRPHRKTTTTKQAFRNNPHRRNYSSIMLRRLTSAGAKVGHSGCKTKEIRKALKPRQSKDENKWIGGPTIISAWALILLSNDAKKAH